MICIFLWTFIIILKFKKIDSDSPFKDHLENANVGLLVPELRNSSLQLGCHHGCQLLLPVLPALTSSLPESTSSPSACNVPAASFFPCYCFAEIFPVCVPNLVAESDFRFFNLPRSTFCPLLMKFGDSYLYVCARVLSTKHFVFLQNFESLEYLATIQLLPSKAG